MFVLVQPEQSFLQLCRCIFEFKPIDNFVHGDTGESEYAVLPRVIEVFGKDVRIEEGFGHPLRRGRGTRRAASFLVSDMDNFINQRRVVRAAE